MKKESPLRNWLIFYLSNNPSNISELVKFSNVSRPTIYHHLEVLEKQGLISREKNTEKKGSPVTIKLNKKRLVSKIEKQTIKFLKLIKKKPGLTSNELFELENKGEIDRGGHIHAVGRGLVEKRNYLTDKGKEVLKKHI